MTGGQSNGDDRVSVLHLSFIALPIENLSGGHPDPFAAAASHRQRRGGIRWSGEADDAPCPSGIAQPDMLRSRRLRALRPSISPVQPERRGRIGAVVHSLLVRVGTWLSPPDGWLRHGTLLSRTDLMPALPSPAGEAGPVSPCASDDDGVAAGDRKSSVIRAYSPSASLGHF